jgi:hypothetical protein
MKLNPWIPMIVGLLIQLAPIPLAIALPETLKKHVPEEEPLPAPPLPSPVATENAVAPNPAVRQLLEPIKDSVKFLFTDWRVPPLVLTFFTHLLLMNSVILSTLYISKRYGWLISDATFLSSLRAGVNIIVFLVLLPALGSLLMRKYAFTGLQKDLWLARISCVLVAVGYAIFGLAPNIALSIVGMTIFTLGNGHTYLIRSFMTSLVEQHHLARLYTIVGYVYDHINFQSQSISC